MLKLKIEKLNVKSQQQAPFKPRRPAWYKATPEHKDEYTTLLDAKLRALVLPDTLTCQDVSCQCEEHSKARDNHVIDILCTLVETSYQCIPLTAKTRTSKEGQVVTQPLPGWNQFVAPLKSDSLFWHSIWMSAGRPNSGSLYLVMCHARRKFHLAVKQLKRRAADIKSMDLLAASEAGDAALMDELRKSLNRKCTGQQVPDSLEGKVTHDEILDKFKDCYEDLYNSARTDEAMLHIKERLEQLISAASTEEVDKITGKLVKEACCRMKPGKIDVTEAYSSDAFLHAPDYLFELLANVFKSFLIHGTVTLLILSCAFLPLFK